MLKFPARDSALDGRSKLIESPEQCLSISCMKPTIFTEESHEYPIAINIGFQSSPLVNQVALEPPRIRLRESFRSQR
jgi:hypothetical protein